MLIKTSQFGELEVSEDLLIVFPEGLVGLSSLKRFVLLEDPGSKDLYWLQSVEMPEFALALIHESKLGSSLAFTPDAADLGLLETDETDDIETFVVINRVEGNYYANLRGPLLMNANRRIGKQVVLSDPAYAVRCPLAPMELIRDARSAATAEALRN